MKKVAAVILCLLMTIGLTSSCEDPTSPNFNPVFEDPNFEALISEALDIPSGEITVEDMLNIFVLDGFQREITNISGIELCDSLTLLNLAANSIDDISPLSGLTNLRSLNLRINKINDIT
ncbi:MAG: leucine-rich repeat domain-containing protein [Candidatus Marinimicrobia bacterium]|nr:leucine-rich repeat domain-containing protein [Candidatus Neomarinimicrobiota bacterium]